MRCQNLKCRLYTPGKAQCKLKARQLSIDENGKCACFEKGIGYYLLQVSAAMDNSNFIPVGNLTKDVAIGIYYAQKIYDVGFSVYRHGNWQMVFLLDKASGERLKCDDVFARKPDTDIMYQFMLDIDAGVLPDHDIVIEEPKKASQPFGWLSPTGVFTEGDFGEHEQVAYSIIKKKAFMQEFRPWRERTVGTARDFLSTVKGYALVHNPSGDGGYIVSYIKPLTKHQKDFLYGYFADMGDMLAANQYAED